MRNGYNGCHGGDRVRSPSRVPRRGGGRPRSPARRKRVLVVDDDPETVAGLADILSEDGHQVDVVGSAEEALERFTVTTYHLLLTDLLLPGKSRRRAHQDGARRRAGDRDRAHHRPRHGEDRGLGAQARRRPTTSASRSTRRSCASASRRCSTSRPDYLPNKLLAVGPLGRGELRRHDGALARHAQRVREDQAGGAVGRDRAHHRRDRAPARSWWRARSTSAPSGRSGPFVAVHTGAIPRELIASRAVRPRAAASFTGAVDRKEGKFELAEGGTIFLDEISTMDERTQINLLRVLESFAYMRIGGKKERAGQRARRGRHQPRPPEDGEEGAVPRRPLLPAEHPRRSRCRRCASGARTWRCWRTEFMRAVRAAATRKPVQVVPAETQRLLEGYHWPGNVRELRNVIEQAVLLARGAHARSRALAADDLSRRPVGGRHPHPARRHHARRREGDHLAHARGAQGQQEDHRRGARHLAALALQQARRVRHRRQKRAADERSASCSIWRRRWRTRCATRSTRWPSTSSCSRGGCAKEALRRRTGALLRVG